MSSNLPVEVQKLIGKTAIKDLSPLKVETGLWQNFCSAIKDSNSLYWDKSEATIHTGDLISHPALLPSWVHDFDGDQVQISRDLHDVICAYRHYRGNLDRPASNLPIDKAA